jgi:hypothetical protein
VSTIRTGSLIAALGIVGFQRHSSNSSSPFTSNEREQVAVLPDSDVNVRNLWGAKTLFTARDHHDLPVEQTAQAPGG